MAPVKRRPERSPGMVIPRRALVGVAPLGVWLCAACGGERPAASVHTAAFCDSVQPRVAAFLARARAEHPTPSDPRYGGTVVVGTPSDFNHGMNPAIAAEYYATQYQQFVLLMTLVGLDDDYRPVPYLARSWELSADSTELTFHLRDDVYWHDGVRTDAEDVAFTYRVVTDPATGFPNPAFWDNYDQSDSAVTVVDDLTVRFRLRPHADILDPWRATAIMPAHLLEDVPHAELAHHPYNYQCPVGNGPFVFDEYKAGDHWTFEANPAFPAELGGRPYLDGIVHRVIPSQSTLLQELRTGGVDIYVGAQPDQMAEIQADTALRVESFDSREFAFVVWNGRRPQLRDARVRRALTMAVDRREIVRAVLKGYGLVAATTVPPFHWAYDSTAVRPIPDQAGWADRDGDGVRENSDGVKMSISIKTNPGVRQRDAILQIMQAQLKDVGVEVHPEFVEGNTLLDQMISPERSFDGVLTSWIPEFTLDDRDLFLSSRIDGPWAWSGTRNTELDRLLDTLQLVMSHEEARPLWVRYEHLQEQEQPYTFLYYVVRLAGVRRALRGAAMDARGEWVNVRRWWLDRATRKTR
jgi:peptide/nickel transport system substrate-binding protein